MSTDGRFAELEKQLLRGSVSIAARTFVVPAGEFRNIVDVFSGTVESLGEPLKQ